MHRDALDRGWITGTATYTVSPGVDVNTLLDWAKFKERYR
jgi:hypothetical protein